MSELKKHIGILTVVGVSILAVFFSRSWALLVPVPLVAYLLGTDFLSRYQKDESARIKQLEADVSRLKNKAGIG